MTDARLVAANNGGGALAGLGQGLQQLGQMGQQVAFEQDRLDAQLAEAGAKTIDNEVVAGANPLRASFLQRKGLDAGVAKPEAYKALDELYKTSLAKATTPRMRAILQPVLDARMAGLRAELDTHSIQQLGVANEAASIARTNLAREEAVSTLDPATRSKAILTGLGEIDARAKTAGLAPEVAATERFKFESGVHRSVIERMLANEAIDDASAYLKSNADRISDADETDITKMLRDPLERRETNADTDRLMGRATGGDAPASFTYANPLHGAGRTPVAGGQFNAHRDYGGHQGIDMPAREGTPVFASGPGTVKVSSSPLGGNIVAVDHGNGKVTRYMHLGKVLVKDGDTVTPDTQIGGVGMTGRTSGPHLHYEIREGGKPIDPNKAVSVVQQSPQRHDLAALLARADRTGAAEGWSPERLDRVKVELQRRVGRDEMLQGRAEQEAERGAYDAIDKLGEQNFTSLAQLPANVRAGLSPQARVSLQNRAQSNARAIVEQAKVKAGGDQISTLRDLATDTPEDFVAIDLRRFRGQITPGEYGSLDRLQRKMRTAADHVAPPVESKARSIIRQYSTDIGLNLTKKGGKWNSPEDRQSAERIYDMMMRDLADDGQGKKVLTEDDYRAAFNRATQTVKVERKGWFSSSWEETPRFRVDKGTHIRVAVPNSDRDAIIGSFRRRYGRAPSEQQIAQIYMDTRE